MNRRELLEQTRRLLLLAEDQQGTHEGELALALANKQIVKYSIREREARIPFRKGGITGILWYRDQSQIPFDPSLPNDPDEEYVIDPAEMEAIQNLAFSINEMFQNIFESLFRKMNLTNNPFETSHPTNESSEDDHRRSSPFVYPDIKDFFRRGNKKSE